MYVLLLTNTQKFVISVVLEGKEECSDNTDFISTVYQ